MSPRIVDRKPAWLRMPRQGGPEYNRMKKLLRTASLNTVCESANCPNRGECFSSGTATFLLMGHNCTRHCTFCNIPGGRVTDLDAGEPRRVAETVEHLGLKFAVVTSVTRDDLPDGGAAHIAATIREIRRLNPGCGVEVLIPDLRGAPLALETVFEAAPEVLNHNLETVPRLYPAMRPQARYHTSLQVLRRARQWVDAGYASMTVKTGIMVGVGETREEVATLMRDAVDHGVEVFTIGQYLQPSQDHHPVERYVEPAEFEELAVLGRELGLAWVEAGPMVRSSYHAREQSEAVGGSVIGELPTGARVRATPALLTAVFAMAFWLAGCAGPQPPPARQPGEPPTPDQEEPAFRGLWITRWDYLAPQDVERAIDDAADLGVTDVFFQMRGQADAFYRSELEPWGHQLGGDPGYDPLALAIVRAHHHGLRLHAWVNVYPLWKGLEPPADPAHPFLRHPGWRLHDETGAPQPMSEFYVVADPTNPEVQDHVAAVMRDICGRYEVDGLHLDYVRFVGEALDDQRLWPGDPPAIERWRRAGGTGDPYTPEGRLIHRAWVRAEISGLVTRIGVECRALRPGLVYSAAVLRHPDIARDSYQQDAAAWVTDGVLDLALPMIYTEDLERFEHDLAAWRAAVPDDRLAPGIGVYKHARGDLAPQLAACRGTAGWSLFAYSSLFDSANPEQDRSPEARALRDALRGELGAH